MLKGIKSYVGCVGYIKFPQLSLSVDFPSPEVIARNFNVPSGD